MKAAFYALDVSCLWCCGDQEEKDTEASVCEWDSALGLLQRSHHPLISSLLCGLFECATSAFWMYFITALQLLTLLNIKDISVNMCMHKRATSCCPTCKFLVQFLRSRLLCWSQWGSNVALQASVPWHHRITNRTSLENDSSSSC